MNYKHMNEYPNQKPVGKGKYSNYQHHYQLCKIVAHAYLTANFEEIFPYLSDDCKWTSYWAWYDREGKDNLIDYYIDKGRAIHATDDIAECAIIELSGFMTPPSPVIIDGQRMPEVRIVYNDGEPAILEGQYINGEFNLMVITLTTNELGQISGIHLMEPSFYDFIKIEDVE